MHYISLPMVLDVLRVALLAFRIFLVISPWDFILHLPSLLTAHPTCLSK